MEFRKRVSWYAKQMNPCRALRNLMRVIDSAADFEAVIDGFLEWRLRHDEDVRAGRAVAEEADADSLAAA